MKPTECRCIELLGDNESCPVHGPGSGPISVPWESVKHCFSSTEAKPLPAGLEAVQRHVNSAKKELNENNDTELRYVAMSLVWALESLLAYVANNLV